MALGLRPEASRIGPPAGSIAPHGCGPVGVAPSLPGATPPSGDWSRASFVPPHATTGNVTTTATTAAMSFATTTRQALAMPAPFERFFEDIGVPNGEKFREPATFSRQWARPTSTG